MDRNPLSTVFRGFVFLFMAALAACAHRTGEILAAPRPNIVLIIADDISQDFGAYGIPIETPSFDALAAGGVLFRNAYVAASSCSPSRASLITGRYPHNHGAPELHMPLPEGQFAFPSALRQAGYYAVAAGKWHLGPSPVPAFDKVNDIAYPDDFTGARTWISELRARPRDRPFFFWLAGFDAHRPWEPISSAPPTDPADVILPIGLPDTPAVRQDYADYLDEVRRFDQLIGDVVAELKAQGVFENTLIVVTSDNGRPFARSKTTLYEGGMRTPLVFHWPDGDLPAGVVSDSLISLIDIAPTFLDIAGLERPASVQGLSMAPTLRNPGLSPRETVFGEQNWHTQRFAGRMVRRGDYVYIRDYTPNAYSFIMVERRDATNAELVRLREAGALSLLQAEPFSVDRPEELLFDVVADPDQTNNLVGSVAHAAVLAEMRSLLEAWRVRTGDSIAPLDQQTPDRNDRETFEQRYPGARPPDGAIPGRASGATEINDPGPR
jgi:N-sulfoglucosamine sulfohydrolase